MCGILCELSLDAHFVFFRMSQFPVEQNDGMADVPQFIIRQLSFQFVVEIFAFFRFDCKLSQIFDMATYAPRTKIEHATQQECDADGKIDVCIVSLKRFCQFGRVRHSSSYHYLAKPCGRIEIRLMCGFRSALDVVTATMIESLKYLSALQMVA